MIISLSAFGAVIALFVFLSHVARRAEQMKGASGITRTPVQQGFQWPKGYHVEESSETEARVATR